MKYITIIFLFILVSGTLQSQQISGKLKDFPSTQFTIRYSPDGIIRKSEIVYVDEGGNFKHQLTMKYPAIIIVAFTDYISQDLFMGPGLQLFFEADFNEEKQYALSIKMTGNAARYNNYFLKLNSSDRFNVYDIQKHYDSILKLPEAEFILFTNSFRYIRDSIRKSFFKPMMKDDLAKYFIRSDSIEKRYNVMYWMIKYAEMDDASSRKIFMDKYVTPGIKPLSEVAAITGHGFSNSWEWYLDYLIDESINRGDTAWYRSNIPRERFWGMLDHIDAPPGFVQTMFGSVAIPGLIGAYSQIPLSKFSQYDEAFQRMIKKIKDPFAEKHLREEWTLGRKKGMLTKTGEPAPDFKIIDTLGIYHHLKDFKGKVLIIDVWSSYCGPCIKEFPLMHQLKEKFNERKDVLFLNISIDQNRKAWIEKGLRKVSPAGICLWAEKGDDSNFSKDYFITHIPHVIVIDKEGKFVAFNAPLASRGDDLEKLISTSLNSVSQ